MVFKLKEIILKSKYIDNIDTFADVMLQDKLFCFYTFNETFSVNDITLMEDLVGYAIDYSIVKDEESTYIEWKIAIPTPTIISYHSDKGKCLVALIECGAHVFVEPILQDGECYLVIKKGKTYKGLTESFNNNPDGGLVCLCLHDYPSAGQVPIKAIKGLLTSYKQNKDKFNITFVTDADMFEFVSLIEEKKFTEVLWIHRMSESKIMNILIASIEYRFIGNSDMVEVDMEFLEGVGEPIIQVNNCGAWKETEE